jgi:hypothetical protein
MGRALDDDKKDKPKVSFRADDKGNWMVMVDQGVTVVQGSDRIFKNFGVQLDLASKGTPPSGKPLLGDGSIMIYGTAIPDERGNPNAHYQIEFSKLEITSGRFEDLTSTETEEMYRKVGRASGKLSVTTTGASAAP